jgi:catechol 2,3-dioxygenase-like lactoylglutathione lyase family enzyme
VELAGHAEEMNALLLVGALLASVVQPAPVRPRLTGISHVAFRVTDAAAARQFYGSVLGLTEGTLRRVKTFTTYRIGHRHHVMLEPGLPPMEEERLSHIAFETTDVKAMAAFLTSRGVRVLQPDDRCDDTAIRVSDPDGHVIEFVEVTWPPTARGAERPNAISTRLLHAGAVVRNEAAAHAFYRDILGFSEIWRGGRTEGVTSWINMRVPDGTDYLEYMLVDEPPDRRQRGVLHHICLIVPDIQSAWEAVAGRMDPAARAKLSPPNVGRNGRWQLNLYDADGTRTELMEPFTIR